MPDDSTSLPALSRTVLGTLREQGNARPAVYLTAVAAGIAAAIAAHGAWPGPVTWVPCAVVIGALQHHLWIAQREALAFLLFRDRVANDRLGGWIAAMLGMTSPARWAGWHEPGTSRPRMVLLDLLAHVTGLATIGRVLTAAGRVRHTPPADWRRLLVAQAAIAGVFLLLGHLADYLWLWLLPLGTIAAALARVRSLVERAPASAEGRLRTIRCSRLEAFFLAPMNVNYLAERRLCNGVPYHNLPRCHQLLAGDPAYRDTVDVETGYLRLLMRPHDKAA